MFIMVIMFLIFALVAGGASLVFLGKKDYRKKKIQETPDEPITTEELSGITRHIEELAPIKFMEDGIYQFESLYLGIGKIDGTNFSVMSEQDQNNRESVLIDILTRIEYPIQFVTTTIVADTGRVAKNIAQIASQMSDNTLKSYASLYAKSLDDMQKERQILSQCSWLVLTEDSMESNPATKLKQKMEILANSLQQRAGIIFTPARSTEEILDIFGQIIDSDRLTKPSEYLPNLKAIHISESEVEKHESRKKTEAKYAT